MANQMWSSHGFSLLHHCLAQQPAEWGGSRHSWDLEKAMQPRWHRSVFLYFSSPDLSFTEPCFLDSQPGNDLSSQDVCFSECGVYSVSHIPDPPSPWLSLPWTIYCSLGILWQRRIAFSLMELKCYFHLFPVLLRSFCLLYQSKIFWGLFAVTTHLKRCAPVYYRLNQMSTICTQISTSQDLTIKKDESSLWILTYLDTDNRKPTRIFTWPAKISETLP